MASTDRTDSLRPKSIIPSRINTTGGLAPGQSPPRSPRSPRTPRSPSQLRPPIPTAQASPCWARGRKIFLERLADHSKKPVSHEKLNAFLNDHCRLDRTINSCHAMKSKAEKEYNEDGSKSKLIGKLMSALDAVVKVGDPWMQYAPESVSIAWSAISILIKVGTEDISQCELVSTASENLVTVILNLRLYENRYQSGGLDGGGDRETEQQIMAKIPMIIASVFEFSWASQKYLESNKLVRSFKEAFSSKIKGKIESIMDDYSELRKSYQGAFQERVMDHVESLLKKTDKNQEELKSILFPSLESINTSLLELHGLGKEIKKKADRDELVKKFQAKVEELKPNEHHTKNYTANFENVKHDYKNMSLFLFNSEEYQDWASGVKTEAGVSMICLTGPRGFGKSVKMTCVVRRLLDTALEAQRQEEIAPIILWFYFKSGDDSTQRALPGLQSLIAQLLADPSFEKSEELMKKTVDIINSVQAKADGSKAQAGDTSNVAAKTSMKATGGHTLDTLRSVLQQVTELLDKPIFIVVDAVDECIDQEDEDLVHHLKKIAHSKSSVIRVIISSRDNINIPTLLKSQHKLSKAKKKKKDQEAEQPVDHDVDGENEPEGEKEAGAGESIVKSTESAQDGTEEAPKVKIPKYCRIITVDEKANSDDLDLYLKRTVTELMNRRIKRSKAPTLFDKELNKIVTSIKTKANGNFAYAALVVASLQQPSQLSLAERLSQLPGGIEGMYKKSLEVLSVEERRLIVMALTRVVWGFSKVTTVEVAEQYKRIYQRRLEDELISEVELKSKEADLEGMSGEKGPPVQPVISVTEPQTTKEKEGNANEGANVTSPIVEEASKVSEKPEPTEIQENNAAPAADTEIDNMSKASKSTSIQEEEKEEEEEFDPLKDPEIADTIYHLRRAGRDFFTFEDSSHGLIDVHGSIREWVNAEGAEALKWQTESKPISSLFRVDEFGQWTLNVEIPAAVAKGSGSAVDIPSKREAHLDTLIYMFQAMAHPNFQKRYMPWDAEAAAEYRPQKDEVFGKPKELSAANVDTAEGSSQNETKDGGAKPGETTGTDTGVPEDSGIAEETGQSSEKEEGDKVKAGAAEPTDQPSDATTNSGTAQPAEAKDEDKEEKPETVIETEDKSTAVDSGNLKTGDIIEDLRRGSADSGISLNSPTAEGVFTSLDDELSKAFGDQDLEKFAADGTESRLLKGFSALENQGPATSVPTEQDKSANIAAGENTVEKDFAKDVPATENAEETDKKDENNALEEADTKEAPVAELAQASAPDNAEDNMENPYEENFIPGTIDLGSNAETAPPAAPKGLDVQKSSINEGSFRQEVRYWINHMEALDANWKLEDRKGEKWKKLNEAMGKFLQSETFDRWKLQYWLYIGRFTYSKKLYTLIDGFEALNLAAYSGLMTLARYLIEEHKPPVDVNSLDLAHRTPLHESGKCFPLTKYLLEHGADMNRMDNTGFTALMVNLAMCRFDEDVEERNNYVQSSKYLLEKGADIEPVNEDGLKAIHFLAYSNEPELANLFLKHDPPPDLHAIDNYGRTLLHHAFGEDNDHLNETTIKVAETFIRKGADVNAQDKNSKAPLAYCVDNLSIEGARLLLEHGADVHDDDDWGFTALSIACRKEKRLKKATELVQLLLDHEAVYDQPTKNASTPLSLAVRASNIEAVKILLKCYEKDQPGDKTHLLQKDINDRTLLYRAAAANSENSVEIAKLILEGLSEEQVKEALESKDSEHGHAPIHVAASHANKPMIEYLISLGADINMMTTADESKSALDIVSGNYSKYTSSRTLHERKKKKTGTKLDKYTDCLLTLFDRYTSAFKIGSELLNAATMHGSQEVLKRLAEHGVKADAVDEHDWSAFHFASCYDTLKILREHFPDYDANTEVSKPTKLPSRLSTTRKHDVWVVSEEGLECTITGEEEAFQKEESFLISADHPIPAHEYRYYFEMTVVEHEREHSPAGIGICPEKPSDMMAMPGWSEAGGFGYHGDDGVLYVGEDSFVKNKNFTPSVLYGPGDTVGLGYDREEQVLFVTRNGVFVDIAVRKVMGKWYPCIGMEGKGKLAVNFGTAPFKFEKAHAPMSEIEHLKGSIHGLKRAKTLVQKAV